MDIVVSAISLQRTVSVYSQLEERTGCLQAARKGPPASVGIYTLVETAKTNGLASMKIYLGRYVGKCFA